MLCYVIQAAYSVQSRNRYTIPQGKNSNFAQYNTAIVSAQNRNREKVLMFYNKYVYSYIFVFLICFQIQQRVYTYEHCQTDLAYSFFGLD